MRDIVELNVSQVRIYPTDCLPYPEIHANVILIQDLLKFKNVQTDGLAHNFTEGVYLSDPRPILITLLTIDPRKVALRVRGTSADADAIYALLWKTFTMVGGRPLQDAPLVKTEESFCVATLDIDFAELIAPSLSEFLRNDGRPKLNTAAGEVKAIDFKALSFNLRYTPKSDILEQTGIALSPKTLVLEPRAGTTMQERRFYASSPTDTSTHLALLAGLEQSLIKARS